MKTEQKKKPFEFVTNPHRQRSFRNENVLKFKIENNTKDQKVR